MNKTIKLLILADVLVLTGFGLIEPILAIFVKDDLVGGTIFAAGLASTLFLITKSVVQLPFSRYIDSKKHKTGFLILGTFITSLIPIFYIFISNINHIYLLQIFHGIGSGLAYPTWLSIWSINLDKGKEGFEWSVYSTAVGIGTAISGAIGAAIAEFVDFKIVFIIVGIASLLGCFILFKLDEKKNKIRKRFEFKRKMIPVLIG